MAQAIINGGSDQVASHGGTRKGQDLDSSCIGSFVITITKSQRLGNL